MIFSRGFHFRPSSNTCSNTLRKCFGNRLRNSLLTLDVQVGVHVSRHRDIRMPKPLLHVFQAETLCYQQACTAMAQVMKADVGKIVFTQQIPETVAYIVR